MTMAEEPVERRIHACMKKKHINRQLVARGWASDPAKVAEAACPDGGICYVQKVSGCKCGATWKLLPKAYMDCIGGKVSLAKMLVRSSLLDVAPRTYFTFESFRQAHVTGMTGNGKWYVKISHLNARRGVTCFPSSAEADAHCAKIEQDKPSWMRYVIQEEVPSMYLYDGKKMLLRLWAFITVHDNSGEIWLHISHRLRANAMHNAYDSSSTERDADVEHCTQNLFGSTSQWEHYNTIWPKCAATCVRICKSMVALWDKKGLPPLRTTDSLRPSGQFNHLAFDFVPSISHDGTVKPYLLEVNVDPSFRNSCPETKAFAEDIADFFVESAGSGHPLVVPDKMFKTLQLR
ncbi:Tubulin glycylase 3C [Diplonema papillatum]|nr:Tubulin glycylase 3C [Diplonema papillatum]